MLKTKAICSMRTAIVAFNSPDDDGRTTTVLLHLQHAFEMLLKAGLQQSRGKVFDATTGRSIGFDKAVSLAQNTGVKVTDFEAGTLRTIDAMRDDQQHWFTEVSEGQLYLHARAGVTLFDDLLFRTFGERLADHLPIRVLPISVEPPQDFLLLVDRDFDQVKQLLQPGRRAGTRARAMIRGLLALEAHVEPDTKVSDTDVNRVELGIKAGKTRVQVFPKLAGVGAAISGEGHSVTVRFAKNEGMPVRLVKVDDESEPDVAAIREVDLSKKYHWTGSALAAKLELTPPRFTALRRHLGMDDDPSCRHEFTFGSQHHVRYSDNALKALRDAVAALDMDEVWRAHNPNTRGRRTRPVCTADGCAVAADTATQAGAALAS